LKLPAPHTPSESKGMAQLQPKIFFAHASTVEPL
jgi:hypothetical protein